MMTCSTDPEAGQPAGDSADTVADPYKESLVMRAGLCALALQIRPFDPDAADRLLQKERAIAQATTTP
jgi:hypothetical protein